MLRTVLMAFFSLAVGYIILVVLIDGVLQDSFPAMIISLLMKFGMSQTEADRVYGTVFMQNKRSLCGGGLYHFVPDLFLSGHVKSHQVPQQYRYGDRDYFK